MNASVEKPINEIVKEEVGALRKTGAPQPREDLVLYDPAARLEKVAAKYRSIVRRRVDKSHGALVEQMKDYRGGFTYNDYPKEQFTIQETTGDGTGQVTLELTYRFEKKSGKVRRFFHGEEMRSEAILSGSLKSFGKDVSLPTARIQLGEWTTERHNALEDKIARYIFDAITATNSHIAGLQKRRTEGARFESHFEAHVACDVAAKLNNPSFLGAYDTLLIASNTEAIYDRLQSFGTNLLEAYNAMLGAAVEESRTMQKTLSDKVKDSDSIIAKELDSHTKAIEKAGEESIARIAAHEQGLYRESESRILAEAIQRKSQLEQKADVFEEKHARRIKEAEKEYAVKAAEINQRLEAQSNRRVDHTDYLQLYAQERLNRNFLSQGNCWVDESKVNELASRVAKFAQSGESRLTGASIIHLIETIKSKVHTTDRDYSGNSLSNERAEKIVALAEKIASRADSDRLMRLTNGIRELNRGRLVELENLERVITSLME